jgi:hypothetical protein
MTIEYFNLWLALTSWTILCFMYGISIGKNYVYKIVITDLKKIVKSQDILNEELLEGKRK